MKRLLDLEPLLSWLPEGHPAGILYDAYLPGEYLRNTGKRGSIFLVTMTTRI